MTRAPVVFDSSVLIPYLRGEAYTILVERLLRAGRSRLSAVVLAELYAGTRSPRDKADVDIVMRTHRHLGRLVTPSDEDWAEAGQGIRHFSKLYGKVEPREHLNDVLILLSAGRVGAGLVTEDAQSFRRWARLLRRSTAGTRVLEIRRGDHLG